VFPVFVPASKKSECLGPDARRYLYRLALVAFATGKIYNPTEGYTYTAAVVLWQRKRLTWRPSEVVKGDGGREFVYFFNCLTRSGPAAALGRQPWLLGAAPRLGSLTSRAKLSGSLYILPVTHSVAAPRFGSERSLINAYVGGLRRRRQGKRTSARWSPVPMDRLCGISPAVRITRPRKSALSGVGKSQAD